MASFATLFRCLALILVLISLVEAAEIVVGGKENSWKIPSSPGDFNKWAEKVRFQIGDVLVLQFDPTMDSVLEVSESDYKTCNSKKPLKSYHDNITKIVLNRSGPFYFISGAEGHCEKGEKLEVEVLSPDHTVHPHSPASAPATTEEYNSQAPAPAPKNGGCRGTRIEVMGCVALIMGSLVAMMF